MVLSSRLIRGECNKQLLFFRHLYARIIEEILTMKKNLTMRILITLTILISIISCQKQDELSFVTVTDRQVLVDDTPYLIKGMCYHPVPKGQEQRSFENLEEDLHLMTEAGVNTIRLYQPVDDKSVLDAMHLAGIKVIISFGYNQEGYFDILSGSFTDYVEKYKDHPAILFWEYGNEYNFHPEWFEGDLRNWYIALNNAVLKSKELDPTHPTATAHGELPDSLALALTPDVDIWGMNVYRWDNPASIFKEWEAISSKPMYLSEAGADSYMSIENLGYAVGVNEKAQADATKNILDDTFTHTNICSGVAIFAFVDEWWKSDDINTQSEGGWAPAGGGVPYDGAANEEYWGLVNIDRSKKEAFDVVKDFFLKN